MAVAGKNSVHKLDNSSGTLVDLSGYFQSASGIEEMSEMLDTSAFGDTSKSFIPGLEGGATMTLTGQWHATAKAHFDALRTAQRAGDGPWTYEYSPAGTGSGSAKTSVEVYVKNVRPGTDVNGLVTLEVTLQGTGDTTNGTH